MDMSEVYFKEVLPYVPRLLSLLDRNPLSATYGSFHRSFWLHRVSDFSSNIQQIGFHSLALVWNHNIKDNPYYQSTEILKLTKAGISYTLKLQKKDGSYDEWYPNERGWAGPTGYILHALCDTYQLIEKQLSENEKKEIITSISSSARFLSKGWEPHILSNHIAMALLPLYEAYIVTNEIQWLNSYNVIFDKFEYYYQKDEGWGLEYDGADIGYQTATLSFLGRLYRINPDQRIFYIAKRSFDFLSHFYFPNGYFSDKMGSRHTSVLFVFAAEFWSTKIPLAAKMASLNREMITQKKTILPSSHEDHYFIYRLPEFLEAGLSTQSLDSPLAMMPFEKPLFRKWFEKAKILIHSTEDHYLICNLGKGGALHIYSKVDPESSIFRPGWIGLTNRDETITSAQQNMDFDFSITETEVTVNSSVSQIKHRHFTPFKMILFRTVTTLFGRHERASRWLKSIIRNLLIHQKPSTQGTYSRKIQLSSPVTIEDKISLKGKRTLTKLLREGTFETRFVPQSRYWQATDLQEKHLLKENDLTSLKKLNSYIIRESL